MNAIPEYLYKVVSPEQWEESLLLKQVVKASNDTHFIHLATEEQVSHVVEKFWKDKDLFVLKLYSKSLIGRLVYESNPGGKTLYYHLYEGMIPMNAVEDILEWDEFN